MQHNNETTCRLGFQHKKLRFHAFICRGNTAGYNYMGSLTLVLINNRATKLTFTKSMLAALSKVRIHTHSKVTGKTSLPSHLRFLYLHILGFTQTTLGYTKTWSKLKVVPKGLVWSKLKEGLIFQLIW